MKYKALLSGIILGAASLTINLSAANIIPANHPCIQYYGRWDYTDPLAPAHGWPGVYIYAEFEGTSIGIRMADDSYYWNVFIDGELKTIFHGSQSGVTSYALADGLPDGQHTILLTKRNEYWWTRFSFNGFILDEGKNLLPPLSKAARKIEFIGDSFTSASGNEYDKEDTPPDPAPYTNIYEGFGPIIARHFNAQYQMSSISGYGMAVDYKGDATGTIPYLFDRTLVSNSGLLWDFSQWQPDLVVICLGLNDYYGFGGYGGMAGQNNADLYKTRYHEFIARIGGLYPEAKILAVAAHLELLQKLVSEVVAEENAAGNWAVSYADFPYYAGGYVNGGHPTVATHHKIADRLSAAIDSLSVWEAESDTTPPLFEKTPGSGQFIVYDNSYTLNVQTDSYATVRYSSSDKPYAGMENLFTTTGKRVHSVEIPVEHGQAYAIYFRAIDAFGNAMDSSAVVRFAVDTTRIVRNWKELDFDDSSWKRGAAPLGSAAIAANKTVIAGVDAAYFRKKFTIADLVAISGMGALIKGNDGAIVYLNGHEIQRINMAAEAEPAYGLFAAKAMTMSTMVVINAQNGLLTRLKNGENILAVEVHRSSANPCLAFDSQLIDNASRFYYKLGVEWSCYDGGDAPADKVQEKLSGVASRSFLPSEFVLEQNYPNPFNPATIISYRLPFNSQVRLNVYDVNGREVATLVDGFQAAGKHHVEFSALCTPLASGLYLYRLQTIDGAGNRFSRCRKMAVVK